MHSGSELFPKGTFRLLASNKKTHHVFYAHLIIFVSEMDGVCEVNEWPAEKIAQSQTTIGLRKNKHKNKTLHN